MSADRLRYILIGLLVVAVVTTPFLRLLVAPYLVVVAFLYLRWRKAAREERRARVFDREAKTDETRTRPDQ